MALSGCGKMVDKTQDSKTWESITVEDEIVANTGEQRFYINNPESEQDKDALNDISLVNPMKELTDEEEIDELSYGLILPKGAEQVNTYMINEHILERRFVVDGADYTMRVAKGDAFEDISGLYYEWSSQTDISYPTEESVHMV